MRANRVTVLVVAPWPPPNGGIATWSVMMRDYAQTQDSVDLDFLTTAHRGMKVAGRTLKDRVLRQGVGMGRVWWSVFRRLRSRSVDVVHVTGTGQLAILRDIGILTFARAFGVPTIYHLRFGRVPDISTRHTIEWYALALALRVATTAMVLDESSQDAIRQHLPSVPVVRVPNPVRVDTLLPSSWRFDPVVVFAGWVTAAKGIEELLEAWKTVSANHQTWKLELVGAIADEYRSHLESSHSLLRVEFCGELTHEDTLEAIRRAGVFVLPSHTEGFPNVILEAMACARPIVATRVGAVPEMLRTGAGLVVSPGNAGELRTALEYAITYRDECISGGLRARDRVLEEFSLPVVFDEYLSAWRSVVVRNPHRAWFRQPD